MEMDSANSTPTLPLTLAELAQDVRAARVAVLAKRTAPVNEPTLLLARKTLLRALQAYTDELTARGLPIPRQLHGELRLQRDIERHPNPIIWRGR